MNKSVGSHSPKACYSFKYVVRGTAMDDNTEVYVPHSTLSIWQGRDFKASCRYDVKFLSILYDAILNTSLALSDTVTIMHYY